MQRDPICIIIAGGSGSGKSSLAYGLEQAYSSLVTVVHFDDYQKSKNDIPIYKDRRNWDHPDSIMYSKLKQDIQTLLQGKSICIDTKSAKHIPITSYEDRVLVTLESKPIILVEGFLALYDNAIRALADLCVFIEASEENRIKRRNKPLSDDFYRDEILLPMHNQFVEPTKQWADIIINTDHWSKEETRRELTEFLNENGVLFVS